MNFLVKKAGNSLRKQVVSAFESKTEKMVLFNTEISQKVVSNNTVQQQFARKINQQLYSKQSASSMIPSANNTIKNYANFKNFNKSYQTQYTKTTFQPNKIIASNGALTTFKTSQNSVKNFNFQMKEYNNNTIVSKIKSQWADKFQVANFSQKFFAGSAFVALFDQTQLAFTQANKAQMCYGQGECGSGCSHGHHHGSETQMYTQGEKKTTDDMEVEDDEDYDIEDDKQLQNKQGSSSQYNDGGNSYVQNLQGDDDNDMELGDDGEQLKPRMSPEEYRAFLAEKTTKTLYVGNINFNTTEEQLSSHFSQFGEIENVRIARGRNNMSKGFAHIQFKTIDDQQKALNAVNNSPIEIDGRSLKVDQARGKKPVSETGGGCYKCGSKTHKSFQCHSQQQQRRPYNPTRSYSQDYTGVKNCYVCGQTGHISRDCPKNQNNKPGMRKQLCYKCGQEGHLSKDCSNY